MLLYNRRKLRVSYFVIIPRLLGSALQLNCWRVTHTIKLLAFNHDPIQFITVALRRWAELIRIWSWREMFKSRGGDDQPASQTVAQHGQWINQLAIGFVTSSSFVCCCKDRVNLYSWSWRSSAGWRRARPQFPIEREKQKKKKTDTGQLDSFIYLMAYGFSGLLNVLLATLPLPSGQSVELFTRGRVAANCFSLRGKL